MEDLIDLIEKKNYKNAKHVISKLKETNPPFFESFEAYITLLEIKNSNIQLQSKQKKFLHHNYDSIQNLFNSIIRKYPSNPDPWRFISIAYSDSGYHEKAKNSLKICFNMGNRNLFVFKKLFCYSMYFKDSKMIDKMKNYFQKEQKDFLKRLFEKNPEIPKIGYKEKILVISEKNSFFEKFRDLKIKKTEDKIEALDNFNDKHEHHVNGKNDIKNKDKNSNISQKTYLKKTHVKSQNRDLLEHDIREKINLNSIDDLRNIYRKDIKDLLNYFIDHEFKLFFYNISKELYESGFIETAVYCLNSFFIIQNNQMDYLNFYFQLFEQNKFDELELLLQFKNDYLVNESVELGKILIDEIENGNYCDCEIEDEFLRNKVENIKKGLSNSCEMLQIYCKGESIER